MTVWNLFSIIHTLRQSKTQRIPHFSIHSRSLAFHQRIIIIIQKTKQRKEFSRSAHAISISADSRRDFASPFQWFSIFAVHLNAKHTKYIIKCFLLWAVSSVAWTEQKIGKRTIQNVENFFFSYKWNQCINSLGARVHGTTVLLPFGNDVFIGVI